MHSASLFPLIRCSGAAQSGAAAIAMVLAYWGRHTDPEALKKYIGITTEGVSMEAMGAAAGRLGMRQTIMITDSTGIVNALHNGAETFPCILRWKNGRYVVLYRIWCRHYYIADPMLGRCCYTRKEMERNWLAKEHGHKGDVLFIEPQRGFYEQPRLMERHLVRPRSHIAYILQQCQEQLMALLDYCWWIK